MECPNGEMKKEKAVEIYSVLMPNGNARVFVDQIFRIFDNDRNGRIDFNVGIMMILNLYPGLF